MRGRLSPLAVLVAGAAALAGCATGSVATLPPPPTTVPASSGVAVPDLPAGVLAAVDGSTTSTSVVIAPGTSTLEGTVTGPGGPVPAAIVDVQRVTDSGRVGDFETSTRADGTWAAPDILGGRYRVRAWRAPDLAATQAITLFLAGGESRQVQIQLQQFGGYQVSSALAPNPPVVDQPANLVVQVTAATVGQADGVVRALPVSGATVQLQGSSDWVVSGPDPGFTSTGGEVGWQLTCTQAGAQPLQVVLADGTSYAVNRVSPCVNPTQPATTTTTSGTGGVTTSTTAPETTTSAAKGHR